MKKVLCLDVDDTVLYWTPHYIKWLFEKRFEYINTHKPDTWFNQTYVKEFNSSPEFSFRKRIKDICDILDTNIPNSDIDVIFISTCGKDHYLNQFRALQVANFKFPWILHTVDQSEDKIQLLLNIKNQYDTLLFVDDKVYTLQLAIKNGIECSLPNDSYGLYKIDKFISE